MRTIRAPRRLLTRIAPIAAAIACAAILSQSAAASDRGAAQESIQEATTIAATVVRADGSPVEGAVVVTSAGGQGVSGRDGAVRFAIDADASLEGAYVTAVASINGVNHVGSAQVDLSPRQVEADAGVIVLSAEGECEPAWLPTFGGLPGMPGLNSSVLALTVFDDGFGDGPALYAAGFFGTAGGVSANNIAKWDGASWSPLGSGVSGSVEALAVYDDGSGAGPALYAGGAFTTAGGVSANRIAKWDGASWSPLGSGMSGGTQPRVLALTVFDDGSGAGPALYAGGAFTNAGGVSANRIAKWDGASWSPLGSGMSGGSQPRVFGLTVFDNGSGAGPALYAGGAFTTAGGETVNHIAKWDGTSWSPLGSGMTSWVYALTVFDDGLGPALYAGGSITSAGGMEANRIAKWDGAAWSPLGSGINSTVLALTVFDDGSGPALFVGGLFTTASGVSASQIAKWDGASWSPLGNGVSGSVRALAVFDDGSGAGPALYAGGAFTSAGGLGAFRIAQWDGAAWSPMGGGLNGPVLALTVYDDGSGAGPALYAGGEFTSAGGVAASRIAKWDGAAWSPLGSGMSGSVRALIVFDDGSGAGPALYAGGNFISAGGVSVRGIAKWDGASWSPLGSGMNGSVEALTVFDDGSGAGPALYAGGWFNTADDMTANHIAKWDGAAWSPLGSGMNNAVLALTVFDDGSGAGPALYAGGIILVAGGVNANHIAKWDGASWSPLGSGMNDRVNALTVFDDGSGAGPALYAGGFFNTAGGVSVNRIAKWDGASWSPLGSGMGGPILALTVFDDGYGAGPALYAGGFFGTAGGETANHIAKWDGASWSPSSIVGINNTVQSLTGFDYGSGAGPALYAGGQFTESPAGDSYLARLQGCPPPCPADLDGDGFVGSSDLGVMLGSWGPCPGCPADLDGDGSVGSTDLGAMLGSWGPCP